MNESTLDRLFGALADPTRRGILQQLARGDAPVNELVASFSLSQPAISKHLRMLEAATPRNALATWRERRSRWHVSGSKDCVSDASPQRTLRGSNWKRK